MKSFSAPAANRTSACPQALRFPLSAFTITELLVVIAILGLLAVTQLCAVSDVKLAARHTRCLSNLRQIAVATQEYKDNNDDYFPYGTRCLGAGTGLGSVLDPTTWPMQLLQYLGGYTNAQPAVYLCPNEKNVGYGWVYQLHFAANRYVLADTGDLPLAVRGTQIRNPPIYWMFFDKGAGDMGSIRSGALMNPVLLSWNFPPGSPQFRRHNGGMNSVAVDGHVECLLTPPYQPGQPPPTNFGELGDTSDGTNPGSTWIDDGPKKLYCRKFQGQGNVSF